jgi:8-oxo-dGTP diphosphatase
MDTDGKRLVVLYEGMTKKTGVSKVVIINDNKILLMQKNGTLKWELPGGHATPGESPKKTAVREVKEETCIKLDKSQLHVLERTNKDRVYTTWFIYTDMVKQNIKISEEHVNYKWVSKTKLDNYELSNSTNHLAIVSSYN